MAIGTEDIAFDEDVITEPKRPEADASPATAEDFLGKKRRTMKMTVRFTEDGPPKIVTLSALPRVELDDLQSKHAPTPKQSRAGAQVNPDTYPPALLAEVVTVPKMSLEQWTEVWTSKEWSSGESMSLLRAADNFCAELLDLSPFDSD